MSNPQNKEPRIKVVCPCGNEFDTRQKRIDQGRGKFCSLACKHKYVDRPKRGKGTYQLVKENKTQFKKGHISWSSQNKGKYKIDPSKIKKGVHYSPETEFKKGNKSWNKGIKWDEMSGDKHPNWRGDEVGYQGIHRWIKLELGYPSLCNRCKATTAKRFEWHNVSGKYKRDILDWERLCSKCHGQHHRSKKNKINL